MTKEEAIKFLKNTKVYVNDILKEDFRGICHMQNCIYNDNGRCEMWDDFAMPEDVNKCDNYEED